MNPLEEIKLLKMLASPDLLEQGKRIHLSIVSSGVDIRHNTYLGNLLVQMYGRCGSIIDARAVFQEIWTRNVFSWTLMTAAYIQNGHMELALRLLQEMDLDGSSRPDSFVFANSVRACAALQDLATARALHDRIFATGLLHSDTLLQNSLVNLYSKCGSLADAIRVFDEISNKDLVSWNSMLRAHVENGEPLKALKLHQRMELEGVWNEADDITLLCLVQACADLGSLTVARELDTRITRSRAMAAKMANGLVSMYAKCGSLEDAEDVFEDLPSSSKSVVAWTCLIDGYAQAGRGKDALRAYRRMELEGVKPDTVAFVAVLGGCDLSSDIRKIHSSVQEAGLEMTIGVATALTNAYGRCHEVDAARKIFDAMPEKNVVTWNSMVAAYSQHGLCDTAIELFRVLHLEGLKPSALTFVNALGACGDDAAAVQEILSQVLEMKVTIPPLLENSLVGALARCGRLLHDDIVNNLIVPEKRDVVSWTCLLGAYSQHGLGDEAMQTFCWMSLQGVRPNAITFVHIINACRSEKELKQIHELLESSSCLNVDDHLQVANALVNSYSSFRCLCSGRNVFDKLSSSKNSEHLWTSMMSSYTRHSFAGEALNLHWQMNVLGVVPDEFTYLSVLGACSSLRNVEQGRETHARILERSLETNMSLACALVTMYGECGCLESAKAIFDGMASTRDVVAWTSMIGASSRCKDGRRTVELFREMSLAGVNPNEVSLTCLLNACSHLGMMDEAKSYFSSMAQDYSISATVEHLRCLVDLLARSGKLDEAEFLVLSKVSPEDGRLEKSDASVALTILLSGCRMHGDAPTSVRAATACLNWEPNEASSYLLVAQICGAA
ncbi:pentatricopeptide repeat-containing protein DOT4, chloroplastic [Selaginella moellendorffii]|uniref:pentatricopeptide repeat-containing protein DOT4, chloroplastic n=1 Tax=Selaginella moellendorffii TaxID=88036 RepID=UPI000D1CBD96|nr:pentatricopeptide repeat-containing protein DOT4, chloroplastic [Selaginella moellendorffii]|eukprot:XP_024515208.1 pentatricopeptide repeat-containing protein DOT4, chloroplastic [Selaginella moellendorffii]